MLLGLSSCGITGAKTVLDANADYGQPISQEDAECLTTERFPDSYYRWHPVYPCGVKYGFSTTFGYKLDCEIDNKKEGYKRYWILFRDGKMVGIYKEEIPVLIDHNRMFRCQ